MTHTAIDTGKAWFLDTLVRLHVSAGQGGDGISLGESLAPHGDSPPLHIHHREDELFYVLEGELRLRVGSGEARCRAGEALLAPRGVPHTYRVESEVGRWLAVTTGGDFERLVRAVCRPAPAATLPEPAGPPTPEAAAALAAAALEQHIEIVGPPLH